MGWRLVVFTLIALVVTLFTVVLLPSGVLSSSVAILAGALCGGWLTLRLDGRSPAALGFHVGTSAVGESVRGFTLGTGVACAALALVVLFGGLRWTSEPGSVVGWLWASLGALGFLAVPAAAEEALLRGYPLQALTEVWGPMWALLLTSGLFAAMHLGNPGVTALGAVNVAVAGVMLGIVFLRTGSLWWATGAHLGWNWAHGFLADTPVSGLELMDAPFYEGVLRGPTWLGGGVFGLEGSVIVTGVLVVATVWFWNVGWLRPSPGVMDARPLMPLTSRHG